MVSTHTGEILCEAGQTIDQALAEQLLAAKDRTPVRLLEARRQCASTRHLLDLFGSRVKLHQPLVLAEVITSPRGQESFAALPGTPIDNVLLQELEGWRKPTRVPPARLVAKVRRGDRGEVVEMSLKDLLADIETHPPLTRDNLIGKRLAADLVFEGEAAPVVAAYQRVTGPIADLIIDHGVQELTAIQVDETIERTLEEDWQLLQRRLEEYLRKLRASSSDAVREMLRKFGEVVTVFCPNPDAQQQKTWLLQLVEHLVEHESPAVAGLLGPPEVAALGVAVLEVVYSLLRPGDPPSVESGRSLLRSMFFDLRRYDLARVGRHKINRKLLLADRYGIDIRWTSAR